MDTSITNLGIMNQLEDTLRTFVKENLERVMKEELAQVLEVEHPEANLTKNGTYERQLDTRYGRVTLRVPRDSKGIFQTQVFQPYRRREGWLGRGYNRNVHIRYGNPLNCIVH